MPDNMARPRGRFHGRRDWRESDVTPQIDRKNDGAEFLIVMDGKSLSYRDSLETALEAGIFLKERHPQSEIVVRDVKNSFQTVIGWKNGTAFRSDAISAPAAVSHVPGPRSN